MSSSKKTKKKTAERPHTNTLTKQKPSYNIEQALANAIRKHQSGNLHQAEEIYREILSVNPNHAETLHAQAIMACQRQQHAMAVTLFEKAIHQDPNKAVYHYNLGNALKDLERFDEAIPCYGQALLLKPDYVDALNNLGTVLHNQGKFEEAISAYQEALRIAPDHAGVHYNMGITLQNMDRMKEAVLSYQKALAANGDFPEVYNRLGKIFYEQGNLDSAIGCFQQTLRIDPNVAAFHFDLAAALKEQGRLDDAIVCYQKVLELSPDMAVAYNNLGNILKEKKRYNEAISHYNKALLLVPDYAIAHGNLASALTQVGELDEATISCREALGINPEIPEVYMLLATLLFMGRRWEEFAALTNSLLNNQNLSGQNRNWLNIQVALQAWITGSLARCEEHLQASASIQYMRPENIHEKSRLAFYCLMRKLLNHRTSSPHLYYAENPPPAYLVGDSHCLCFANLPVRVNGKPFIVEPRLVMGCKAFHLHQNGNNQYKAEFLSNIEDIPDNSLVILSFGEIDCRQNEGIYPAWMKKFQHLSPAEMIRDVTEGYLAFIADTIKERELKLMVLGVPAPMKSTVSDLTSEEIPTYLSIPKLWNDYLQTTTLQNGWTFLDNYSLTCDDKGFSHGRYHIDDHHLYPTALPLLLSEHAITPYSSP
ncbi:MAG: tetratricopeptide repeat protein [Proteobacteria bacterium]|nr:tetratricopeptide repeat protein [Pseudomonadota bacterium]